MDRSPADSVGRFRRHLRVLQHTSPAASSLASAPETPITDMPAIWRDEARRLAGIRRRRQIAASLLTVVVATFVLGLIPAFRPLLYVNVVVDALFVAYLVLLARIRSIETERQMTAHFNNLRVAAEQEAATQHAQSVADVAY